MFMLGFKFRLESLYFTSFRKATSSSILDSYKIPPFTTLRGLMSNALGLKRDDLYLQDLIKIGIKAYPVEYSSEMTKVLKLKSNPKTPYNRYFPSSPMFKEFLINPVYDIYVGGDDEIVEMIHDALINPKRDLYIGSSDDLVDIEVSDCFEIFSEMGQPDTVIEGLYENSFLEKIPYKFNQNKKSFSLEEKIVSIPKDKINKEVKVFNFNGDKVILI